MLASNREWAVCKRFLFICGVLSIFAVSSAEAQRLNWYRSLMTRYDSVVVSCTFGEICLPSNQSDTVFISWVNSFTATFDTTRNYINRITQSNPFVIDSLSTLSVFRMLACNLLDETANTWSLPDTTAWTMELWNWSTHEKIATLDSLGLCKAENLASSQFPGGFGQNWDLPCELVSIDVGPFAQFVNPGDSVIIRLKIHTWSSYADSGTSVQDNPTSLLFSQWLPTQLPKRMNRPTRPPIGNMGLSVFPNPATSGWNMLRLEIPTACHVTITLTDAIGKSLMTILDGTKEPGIHSIPFSTHEITTGTYFIRAVSEDLKEQRQAIIIVKR
jgi:hypothetical protein